MALSGKERQKRWRKRHPEEAAVRLDAYKLRKAMAKPVKTAPAKCKHEGPPIDFLVCRCGTCGEVHCYIELSRSGG